MGKLYSAYCPCGYKQDVSTGGNRSNFREVDRFPFVCKSCKSLFSSNRRDRTHPCTHCESTDTRSYKDLSLKHSREPPDGEYLASKLFVLPPEDPSQGRLLKIWRSIFPKWEVVQLEGGEYWVTELKGQDYFCPRCEKFTLSFEQTAFTD